MSRHATNINTKAKKLIYSNGITVLDIIPYTRKVDKDGYGLSQQVLYGLVNNKHSPTIPTILILCKALSLMLEKKITPNDVIDFD